MVVAELNQGDLLNAEGGGPICWWAPWGMRAVLDAEGRKLEFTV